MNASLNSGSLRLSWQWPVAAALLLLSLGAPARDGHGGAGPGGGSHARAGHGDRHAGDRHIGARHGRHSGRSHGHRFHDGGHAFFGLGYWPSWYPPYGYGYPPATVLYTAPVYVERADESQSTYWYYCPDSRAYYPSVAQCPSGWLRVVPGPVTQ